MALNEYEDDHFIAKELFLKSNREEEVKEVSDRDLFQYDVPLFQNIFDDFEAVLDVCRKYGLAELDYDQVKLIHTVIVSKQRVQIIEDAHDLIANKLFLIFGNYLGYKVLDLANSRVSWIKKEVTLKAKSHNRIIIQMSRCDK